MKLVKDPVDPENLRKKYNASVLRMRVNDCETLEELFEVIQIVEATWKSGDIYKYAYHCLKDEILKKEELLIKED